MTPRVQRYTSEMQKMGLAKDEFTDNGNCTSDLCKGGKADEERFL